MSHEAKQQLFLELVQGLISKEEAAQRFKEMNPAFIVQSCNRLFFRGKEISETELEKLGQVHDIHSIEIAPGCVEPVTDEADILDPDTGQRLADIEAETPLKQAPKKRPPGAEQPGSQGTAPQLLGGELVQAPPIHDEQEFYRFRTLGFPALPSWIKRKL